MANNCLGNADFRIYKNLLYFCPDFADYTGKYHQAALVLIKSKSDRLLLMRFRQGW